ncbi:MAG: hypothetical protein IJT91_03580 [Clostridia bacterium]|nr:hypothetical protein [Clostridia bacterium]
MNIVRICGAAVLICVIGAVTARLRPEISKPAVIAAGVILSASVVSEIIPTVRYLSSLGGTEEYPLYLKIMLKGAGAAILTETVSDICSDCGENALAAKVELAGKFEIIAICLPLIKQLVGIGTSMIGQ